MTVGLLDTSTSVARSRARGMQIVAIALEQPSDRTVMLGLLPAMWLVDMLDGFSPARPTCHVGSPGSAVLRRAALVMTSM